MTKGARGKTIKLSLAELGLCAGLLVMVIVLSPDIARLLGLRDELGGRFVSAVLSVLIFWPLVKWKLRKADQNASEIGKVFD